MSEQTFFDDPALDRLMQINLLLAAELHVTRDRLRAVEALLEYKGLANAEAIETLSLTGSQQAAADADRDRLIVSLLAIATGKDD